MKDYTFHTLNDKDFELIARDLLQKELGLRFETFKSGIDQGIDLRFATTTAEPNEIVVQAKHWAKSGFSKLHSYLSSKELPKIKALKPARYILVTSVALNPANKQKILKSLSPYILSTADILGRDDLNNLLERHSDVEKSHYKLWISSTNVMRLLLNNAVSGRSQFVTEQIEKKACLFVPTNEHPKAVQILNERRALLIKGAPGVGKTTLAEFLLYELIKDGFELVVIADEVRDAEDLFDPDKKQVFYFDDFLGSNYLEILHGRGSGSQIRRFVDRVKSHKNKRLILTTRTTILNQASQQLSSLNAISLQASEFELHIKSYSRFEKGKILYNHLFFSDADPDYFEILFEDENYLKIIDHNNYNPRIIEFLTDADRLASVNRDNYLKFVVDNLDKPEEIWEHSYTRQIDVYAQLLVVTLFSLGMRASEDVLRRAYESRMEYEVANGGLQRVANPFHSSVKLLLGGFINHTKAHGRSGSFSFVNPSIVDFLIGFLTRDPEEKWRILESAIFVEQFASRFSVGDRQRIPVEIGDHQKIVQCIRSKKDVLTSAEDENVELNVALYLCTHFEKELVEGDVTALVQAIQFDELTFLDFGALFGCLEKLNEAGYSALLDEVWDEGIRALFTIAEEMSEYDEIVGLFRSVHKDLAEWMADRDNREHAQESVDSFWFMSLDTEIQKDDGLNNAFEHEEFDIALESLRGRVTSLNERLCLDESPEFSSIDEVDDYELIAQNRNRAEEEDHQADQWRDMYNDRADELGAIRELFSR